VNATPDRTDEFSRVERAALARWQAPSPPPDFADRVLARALAGAAPAPPPRGRLAVAALALLVLGSALSIRSMVGSPTAPGHDLPGALGGYDAGLRPEVNSGVSNDVASGVSAEDGARVGPSVGLDDRDRGGAQPGDDVRDSVRDGVSRNLTDERAAGRPDSPRDPRGSRDRARGQPS
jgi:hypothetical protein